MNSWSGVLAIEWSGTPVKPESSLILNNSNSRIMSEISGDAQHEARIEVYCRAAWLQKWLRWENWGIYTKFIWIWHNAWVITHALTSCKIFHGDMFYRCFCGNGVCKPLLWAYKPLTALLMGWSWCNRHYQY